MEQPDGEEIAVMSTLESRDVASLADPATMRMLIESSLEGLAVFDEDRRWLYMNPAGRTILGLSMDDLSKTTAFAAPDLADHAYQSGDRPQVVSNAAVMRPLGGRCLIEYVATPLPLGAQNLTAVSFRDTTELARERQRLTAFYDAARQMAYRGSLEQILDGVAGQVVQAADLAMAQILILDGANPHEPLTVSGEAGDVPVPADFADRAARVRSHGGVLLSTRAINTRQPVLVRHRRQKILSDPRWAPLHEFFSSFDWSDILAIPLLIKGRPLGSFVGYFRPNLSPGPADVTFLRSITDQAAIAIETTRLIAASQDRAETAERHRIARDLHDTVSQQLFSLGLHGRTAQLAAQQVSGDGREILDHSLRALIELAENAQDDMRGFVFKLHPTSLTETGLGPSIVEHAAAVAEREHLDIVVDIDQEPIPLPEEAIEDTYRVVVEALHNVVKHAEAAHCTISVRSKAAFPQTVDVEIHDDGVGLCPGSSTRETFGLVSMRERAERLGATLEVSGTPNLGTTVRLVIPIRHDGLPSETSEPVHAGQGPLL